MRHEEVTKICLSLIEEITGRNLSQASDVANASVFELGIDSLSIIKLIFALEDHLNIEVPLADLDEATFASVHNLADHLLSLQVSKAA